jgi:hypothetical protein
LKVSKKIRKLITALDEGELLLLKVSKKIRKLITALDEGEEGLRADLVDAGLRLDRAKWLTYVCSPNIHVCRPPNRTPQHRKPPVEVLVPDTSRDRRALSFERVAAAMSKTILDMGFFMADVRP